MICWERRRLKLEDTQKNEHYGKLKYSYNLANTKKKTKKPSLNSSKANLLDPIKPLILLCFIFLLY
ncbi:hypothetical protein DB42_EV00110 [Neochlamydia sp. EPS4]|nr:hypothetical protein DB42_EV00110 [Neochlamydia sp. EPS4]